MIYFIIGLLLGWGFMFVIMTFYYLYKKETEIAIAMLAVGVACSIFATLIKP